MTTMATGTLLAIRRERQRERAWIRMFCVEALIEQHGKCAYCHEPLKRTEATADHVNPLVRGGPTTRDNIKAACEPCNKTKGGMSEGAFLKLIKAPPAGSSIHVWLAWSRRRIWLARHRADLQTHREDGRMTQPHAHFDEAKVLAVIEQARARYAADLDKPGPEGVEARFKNAMAGTFSLALVREMNRGTGAGDMLGAVAGVMAHAALTYVCSVTGGSTPPEVRVGLMNCLTLALAQIIEATMAEPELATVGAVQPEPSGRA